MRCGGKPGHVHTDLSDDRLRGPLVDPRDGVEPISDCLERLDLDLDLTGDLSDGRVEGVDMGQHHPTQKRVVLAEPTSQRLNQRGDLAAHPCPGVLSKHTRVALAVD